MENTLGANMNYTLITGSTGGLGGAYAIECAKRGYNLFLTGTRNDKLKLKKEELIREYPSIKIEYFACDLTNEDNRRDMLKHINQMGITINRIILNAGIDFEGPILEKSPDEIMRVVKVNIESTIHLFHMALLQRVPDEKFYVLVVSSLAGYYAMPQKAIYSSSKAMLTNFFTSIHEELKDYNVNVSIVCPGGMPTTQEMINSIKAQGVMGKWSSTPVEKVAKMSLHALDKNKLITIPGGFNKLLRRISFPLSRRFVASKINNRWKKTRKKAKELGN